MNTQRVLITGMGGDLGQALAKCVRLMAADIVLLGADRAPDSVGRAFADGFHTLPSAGEPGYLDAVAELCRGERCTALVPGSRAEMDALSAAAALGQLALPCPLVCQPHPQLALHGDKLRSYESLRAKAPLADFADGASPEQVERLIAAVGFPLVVKPRVSSGSRDIRVVRERDELTLALDQTPLPVVQEFIEGQDDEFSVGLFADGGALHAVAFRRSLGPVGASWRAETSDDAQVLDYCRAVGRASGLRGSFNIQVRKSRKGVALLEINPRFSSLVAARAYCGFRDLEWSLFRAWGLPLAIPETFAALRFQRFFHELVDTGAGYHAPEQWLPRTTAK